MSDAALSSFRPARSFGWAWLMAIMALVLAPMAPILVQPGVFSGDEAVGAWIAIAVIAPIVALMLLALVSLPQMRYDLERDALVISCGRMLRYRVPFSEITDVRRADLTPSLWSSMRMPGLALWTVPYADIGRVRMCATRMATGILLIEAGGMRYGITPADEQAFVTALMMMLPKRGH
ncbi:MAG: PH domain-containing protein [Coriobacteriia bacterium]|nr:PH domain-containing protein [Coriobacteriia bacterium]